MNSENIKSANVVSILATKTVRQVRPSSLAKDNSNAERVSQAYATSRIGCGGKECRQEGHEQTQTRSNRSAPTCSSCMRPDAAVCSRCKA